ncbi:PEP-CTERM sorting domain-containing protein [Agarivorans litoreus]|uniref:PEP-CTERM sorting domain-containing protein n=1 Tax=Agarivorans litoreus TaxID=1510455 RepID=UPI001C7D2F52|nr:PEP-CTERM sorting domain-containing protein [Agarivorans litoreus]
MLITRNILSVSLLLLTAPVQATIIAYDMLNSSSLNLIEYQNPFSPQFASDQDGFDKYQAGPGANIPNSLIDSSLSTASDNLGIVNSQTDQQSFFGVSDTLNPNNPSGNTQATWQFDIGGFSLTSISISMAAMGDFESSDYFSFSYAIDASPIQLLFASSVGEQTNQSYTMANGSQYALNDPLSINGQVLNNQFQQLSQSLIGSGSIFSLYFNANQNGGNEAFAFREIIVNGENLLASQVPEPSSIWLVLLGLVALKVKRSQV